MADAVTSTTISDGTHKAVIQITNLSDGTGEDAVNKVDVSGLAAREDGTACSGVVIEKVSHSIIGFTQVQLLFDADTDAFIIELGENQSGDHDYSIFGGLTNNAGTGKTGDIMFTTVGASSADTYTVILYMRKGFD